MARNKVALLLALMLVFTNGVLAQGGAGDLSGVVYDQTGAVIPKTKVTLTNEATGVVRTTETGDAGTYRFVALPVVGTYKLKIEVAGFKNFELANIVISVARNTTEDVKLEVGAATTTVNVEAGAELVQTSESQLSELVDRRAWQSLPLQFRDSNTFINLLPGVVGDDFGGTTRGAAVNGIRPGSGNFMIEGFDNNDQGQGGRGAAVVSGGITSVSPEAIQEYRIVTSVFAAEYGKAGGFVNDMVLRSGTNDWHGSAFWYNRVQALAANDFFSNKNNVKDRLVRNQFGGSFGGPMIKDRTFGFVSYEGHLLRSAAPVTTTGTTQQFIDFVRTGAFRTFMETNVNGICNNQIFLDSFFGDGSVASGGAPAACVGAFASSATLGPVFRQLTALQNFPVATDPTTFQFSGGGPYTGVTVPQCPAPCVQSGVVGAPAILYPVPIFGQVTDLNSTKFNENRLSTKIDHRFGANDTLAFMLNFHDHDFANSNNGGDGTIGSPSVNPGRTIAGGLTWQHTFTPMWLNQFRFGYLRDRADFPTVSGYDGIPSFVTAFDPLGVSLGMSSSLPQFFTQNQFQLKDDTSMVKGRHTFKTGFEYRRTRNGSAFEAWKNGLYLPYGVEELLTDGFFGDEADQAVLGYAYYGGFYYAQASVDPTRGTRPEYYRGYRANEWATYVQDDWKIHPRLTLNIGLRYEYFGPPHNFRSGIDSNFYFGSPTTPVVSTSTNSFFPFTSPLAASVSTGSFQLRDNEIWQKDRNNFAPRFGFAWDVFGSSKFVLRGGYGVTYDRMWNNLFENIRFNAPFFSNPTIGVFRNGQTIGPLSTPGILSVPFTNLAPFLSGVATPSPRHMDENLVTAYTQQFFLGTQWAFAKDFAFEMNYTGTMGNKLLGVIDINTFNGRVRGGSTRRPNPTIAGDNFRSNAFRSNYHGMQMILRKAFSNGLQFNANYTWSHAIDMLSDAFNGGRGQILRPTDNLNTSLDRGNADFDLRHRFVMSYFYELPWMKANRWIGGWSLSGVTTFQTGVPVQIFHSGAAGDPNGDGYRTDRPIFTGSGGLNSVVTGNLSPADGYFPTTAFRTFAANGSDCATFGVGGQFVTAARWWCNSALGRNLMTGPGFANFDFSVAKKFRLTETLKMEFQANFFNIFNHTNFGNPTGNMTSPNFGKSTFTQGNPRITQLALRFDF